VGYDISVKNFGYIIRELTVSFDIFQGDNNYIITKTSVTNNTVFVH